jgi:hypothetical protein
LGSSTVPRADSLSFESSAYSEVDASCEVYCETALSTLQELGQVAEVQGGITFPSDYVVVNILQLAKSIGWENSIGWGKRYSWFNENIQKWFDVDQQGMLSR